MQPQDDRDTKGVVLASVTVDLESDCPPYLGTWRGIEEGLPRLLQLLAKRRICATFFSTGCVAQRYPDHLKFVLESGHELGSHGFNHRRLDSLDHKTVADEIRRSVALLRSFGEIVSFRAPYLAFSARDLPLLVAHGLRLDSSGARYKLDWYRPHSVPRGLARVPVSVTSSVLRLPRLVRNPWLRSLASPAVLMVHPWEFVDLRYEPIRLDCRFRTGDVALQALEESIDLLKARGFRFVRLRDHSRTARPCNRDRCNPP